METNFAPEKIYPVEKEKIQWKVEGMHCANCALTINNYLKKQGAQNITVNPIDGGVAFELIGTSAPQKIAKGIESLGYKVESETLAPTKKSKPLFSSHIQRFWACLPFTLLLMVHMGLL